MDTVEEAPARSVEEKQTDDDTLESLSEEDEELESLEALPAAEEEIAVEPQDDVGMQAIADDGTAVDLGIYLGPCIHYRPFTAFERAAVFEELPVVGDGEPWSELEFLGDEAEYGAGEEEENFTADDGGIIEYRDGVFRLNAELGVAGPKSPAGFPEDPEMRALVDSVLSGNPESQ
jgi:hypothetical protein